MYDIYSFIVDLIREGAEVIAAFIVGAFVAGFFGVQYFGYRNKKRMDFYKERFEEAAAERQSLERQLEDIQKTDGRLWLKPPSTPQGQYKSRNVRETKFLSFINLKGGVGKTTLAAHLGSLFAASGKRVLLVDLDYQNSLTTLVLSATQRNQIFESRQFVNELLRTDNSKQENLAVALSQSVHGYKNLDLIAASGQLEDIENRLLGLWLSNSITDDPRFFLTHHFHSESVLARYDYVIFDCPPRLTAACVNGLICSDYVIVPVLLDNTSVEGVPRLLDLVKDFRDNISTELKILGVVANRKNNARSDLLRSEKLVWTLLETTIRDAWENDIPLFPSFIKTSNHVSNAANEHVLASHDAKLSELFNPLYKELRNAM